MIIVNPKEKYVPLNLISADERPREKLKDNGSSVLSNAEIMAILIGSGTREKSAIQLCSEILSSVNNDLNQLARLTIHDLQRFKGIGEAKAIAIQAALELGKRKQFTLPSKKMAIKSSKDIYDAVWDKFKDLNHEEFYIVLLNRANRVKSIELISKGGFSGTIVDGKMVFKKGLEQCASNIVLCHNHPSGNLMPSRSDIELTKKLKSFGAMIDLPILDHLIITDDGYYSFADEGVL